MVLESKTPALRNFDESRKRLLKARAPDICGSKFHIDYYNFIQQCEDYFATSEAKSVNKVSFTAIFLKDQALFC